MDRILSFLSLFILILLTIHSASATQQAPDTATSPNPLAIRSKIDRFKTPLPDTPISSCRYQRMYRPWQFWKTRQYAVQYRLRGWGDVNCDGMINTLEDHCFARHIILANIGDYSWWAKNWVAAGGCMLSFTVVARDPATRTLVDPPQGFEEALSCVEDAFRCVPDVPQPGECVSCWISSWASVRTAC